MLSGESSQRDGRFCFICGQSDVQRNRGIEFHRGTGTYTWRLKEYSLFAQNNEAEVAEMLEADNIRCGEDNLMISTR